jgi:hypothetical protein
MPVGGNHQVPIGIRIAIHDDIAALSTGDDETRLIVNNLLGKTKNAAAIFRALYVFKTPRRP